MEKWEELNLKIRQFCEERDWNQFHHPKNMAMSLVLEAAEVLEVFQWQADNSLSQDQKQKLEKELSDVLYWVLRLSDRTGINIMEASLKKLEENAKKYPVEKAKGNAKKYTEHVS